AIATGLAMSPSIAARFPWYIRLFRGRQAARSIHFLCLCAFFSFFIMHVSMVIAHGAISEMGLIVLGDIHHLHGMLGLILGLAGLTGIIVIHMVATRFSLSHPRVVQRSTQTLTDPLRRAFDRRRSALTVRSSRYGVTTDSSYRERDVTVAQPGADVMWPRDCEMVSAARESRGPSGRMGSRATRKRSHKPRSSLSATQHG
ncbi:MAG TPA: hypothetical protein VKO87_00090, partial [Gemmatimonadaceae bacterium]|nr:hypothetical protein [Gemmatimonadaceae bacterium]